MIAGRQIVRDRRIRQIVRDRRRRQAVKRKILDCKEGFDRHQSDRRRVTSS